MRSLPYIALAAVAGIGGGVLTAWWTPGKWVTSYIQHCAGGVVIAAVALNVMPGIARSGAPPLLVLGSDS